MSNGSATPALIFLGLLFFFGAILPLFVSGFIDTSYPNTDSSVSGLVDVINNGINISIPIIGNVVFIIPFISHNTAIEGYANAFTYVPDYVIIPVAIIMIILLVYAIIALIHG